MVTLNFIRYMYCTWGGGGGVCIYVHTCIYICACMCVCVHVCVSAGVCISSIEKGLYLVIATSTIGLPIKASHILRGLHVNMEASVRVDGVIRTSSSFNWSQTGVCAGTLPA